MPATPPTAPRRWLWWTTGTLAAIALILVVCEVRGWPFLQNPLQNLLTRSAGVPVTLGGDFNLHVLWNPRLRVGHLQVAPGGGVQVPHLLDAKQVDLVLLWGDLWRWRRGQVLRVQALEAEALSAYLVRGKDGRASWQLGAKVEPPAKPEDSTTDPLADLPRFGSLRVGTGRINVDDQPSQTRLLAELHGGEGDALPDGTLPGYRASLVGRWQALPLNLQLRTGSALPLLQDAENNSPSGTLRVEGSAGAAKVLFDGTASALLGERQLQGQLRLSGPSLAQVGAPLNVTLPQTPPFSLRGALGHDGGVWHLKADSATIGRSQLNGDFRFDTRSTPGRLSGRLGGTRLALADLGPSVGAPTAASSVAVSGAVSGAVTGASAGPSKGAKSACRGASAPAAATGTGTATGTGRVLPQRRFDLPSLRAMDADVQVAIDEFDFGSDALAPLKGLQTRVLLERGVLQLQALKASVAGGQFSGSTSLDANADPARWATDLRFAAIDVAGWVRGVSAAPDKTPLKKAPSTAALKTRRDEARQGGAQPVKDYITGTLTGHVQAVGRGRSTAEILATLDGQAQVRLKDGTLSHLVTELAGLDLAQALGVLIRQDQPLPLRCGLLDLQIQQGVVRPRQAVLDNADSTLRLVGQVDLRDETMALQAQVKPKDFSPLTLRVPIVINGTLGAPVVGLDGKRLAGKALGALALGVVFAPAAALLPLLDPGSRETGDPCAAPVVAGAASAPTSAKATAARR